MDYRLNAAQRDELIADLDDAASRAGGLLSRVTRPRTLLRALEPWTDPAPGPVSTTILGACPLVGGMSLTAGERVITRWGQGAAVRLFSQSGWTVAPVLPDAGRILASWKPLVGELLNVAAVLAAVAPLPAGSRVTVIHESDVKILKGSLTFEQAAALHRQFAAIIREHRPDLVLVGIVAGYRFHPDENLDDLARYIDPDTFDMLGVDLDGITTKYADFTTFIPGVMAYLERIGKIRWTVPEFGAPRQASDADGTVRAAWMTEQVKALRALPNPPEEIALFESTAYAGTQLTTQVEIDAWAALIG